MALIEKETIRAEIERRLSNIVTGLDFTAEIELKGLLSFLDSIPPIQSLNRDHVAKIIELWQDVEHDVEWCNEPSEFMYDEVLRRFNLDTLPDEPKKPDKFPGITRFCDVADNITRIASGGQTTEGLEDERATMQSCRCNDI